MSAASVNIPITAAARRRKPAAVAIPVRSLSTTPAQPRTKLHWSRPGCNAVNSASMALPQSARPG